MKNIEEIVLWQGEKRGMDVLAKYSPVNFCQQAAKAIFECKRGVLFLLTGFYVNGVGETDGPPGAYFLARALKEIGFYPVIVSDIYCKDYFKYDESIKSIIVENDEIANGYYDELIEKFSPEALISIERCGRNSSGRYLNMRGKDITNFTVNLDELFLLAKGKLLTIGIGDGGNEIGMGNLQHVIASELKAISASIIPADYLITAAVSNWGSYGLIGYLQLLSGKKLLPSFDEIEKYLAFIVSKGAVDGVKQKQTLSVDGHGLDTIKVLIEKIHSIVEKTSQKQRGDSSQDVDTDNNRILTDIPLEERLLKGLVTRKELLIRAKHYWETVHDDLPVEVNGSYGCPICYSKLDATNRLVREDGVTVCDYCVSYVEGYI